MRSRSSRSRPRWSSKATRSRRPVWRSAAWRTSLGATRRPKRRCAGRAPTQATFTRAADVLLRDAKGFAAQHLQDRSRAPRHRPRADAGGSRHAAIAVRTRKSGEQEHAHDHLHRHRHIPRRRPRQGHRRGEIRRRVQRCRPRPCQRRHIHASPRAASRASTRARRCGRRRDRRAHASESAAHGRAPTAPTRTMWRRKVRRSGRSTTTGSGSAASRSRWWSPKSRRSRASRRRWSAWNTTKEAHVTDVYPPA